MSEPKKDFSTEQEAVTIPFFVHEATVSRLERIIKRIVILTIIIFAAFVGTNVEKIKKTFGNGIDFFQE